MREPLMISIPLRNMTAQMARSERKSFHNEGMTPERRGKHKLDEIDAARVAKHLVLFRPTEQSIEWVLARARLSIPGLATTSDVLKVMHHNPDCVFALARNSKFHAEGE